MAIPNSSRNESLGAIRVDSDASHRYSHPSLRLYTGSEVGEEFPGDDSYGTSSAIPAIAKKISVVMHRSGPPLATQHSSAAYIATIRRGEIQRLFTMFIPLNRQADREDFAVCFFPIVNGIRQLLDRIAGDEREGNTREILRRLRDTFLDGGWSLYRGRRAREAAEEIFDYLATAEHVTRDDVERFSGLIRERGLKLAGIPLFDLEDESEGIDVEEEEEVSD